LPQTIQFDELHYEQERDAECSDLFDQRGELSTIDINDDGLLVRKAPLDGAEQIVIPLSLRGRILHLEHYFENGRSPWSYANVPLHAKEILLEKYVHRCGGSGSELLRLCAELHQGEE
jgi:hypothetical protein